MHIKRKHNCNIIFKSRKGIIYAIFEYNKQLSLIGFCLDNKVFHLYYEGIATNYDLRNEDITLIQNCMNEYIQETDFKGLINTYSYPITLYTLEGPYIKRRRKYAN